MGMGMRRWLDERMTPLLRTWGEWEKLTGRRKAHGEAKIHCIFTVGQSKRKKR